MHTSIYSGLNFYVYLITDLNPIGTEKYYIGSATRKELIEKNIDPELDDYYGSSTVPHELRVILMWLSRDDHSRSVHFLDY